MTTFVRNDAASPRSFAPSVGGTDSTPGPAVDLTDGAVRRQAATRYDVCVLGMGYVGLPSALSLTSRGRRVLGIDASPRRLDALRLGDVDAADDDVERLALTLQAGALELSTDAARLADAAAILVCVPTPIDHYLVPDLSMLRSACAAVVEHARQDQTVILTSTTYVGSTRDLLVAGLARRGLIAGRDVFVAFSPERIDPGNTDHPQQSVPRVVGGVDAASSAKAAQVLTDMAPAVHIVSSAEAAEMTKLYENTFRAVNIALALEMSQAASALGLSIIEVIGAASTKPYGFMPFYPGPGVGGHCIPCDPHYLLWQLRRERVELPLVDRAMGTIAERPRVVAQRLRNLLADRGVPAAAARIVLVGAAYKPGVRDTRESPAIELARELLDLGADLVLWDPVAVELDLGDGRRLVSVEPCTAGRFDAAVVHTAHPGLDLRWLEHVPLVLDATYRLDGLPSRELV